MVMFGPAQQGFVAVQDAVKALILCDSPQARLHGLRISF